MNKKQSLIVTIITLSIFLFTSVGFAIYNVNLSVNGTGLFPKNGEIFISNVVLSSYSNLENPADPVFTNDSISFDLNFVVESNSNLDDDYSATYDITITNESFFPYAFASSVFNPSVETINNQDMNISYDITGIEVGEIIPKLSSKTFSLTISMFPRSPGNYNVSGDSEVNLNEEGQEETGSLLASIPSNSAVNLINNTRDKVVVTVINTFETPQTFSFSSGNSNFVLVNNSGNSLGSFTIPANTTNTYDVYIEIANGIRFATDSQPMNLLFTGPSSTVSLGNVTCHVPKDNTLLDDEPPVISNVSATFVAQNGVVNLSWNATDVSGIDHFIIDVMDDSDNLVKTITTTNANTSYQVNGLTNGTYYFKVYGEDIKQFNGKTIATSCGTGSGFCSQSASDTYTWTFPVTFNLTDLTTNGADTCTIGTSYSCTLNASGLFRGLPNSVTIKMNNQTLNSGYSYNNNSGLITINNVTGPIEITAAARTTTCLVKGTKILLANGTYKNIEDVTYNDLLAVWSYENGNLTYEYPIWIEQTKKSTHFQRTHFSDGSYLDTIGYHGVFSPTYNMFISVDDNGKYRVGTKITKIANGKLKEVTITKIEMIYKPINYYHVVSTRYYNIIANDFLTTDGTVVLSNLYGFDKNITWPKTIRDNVVNNKNNLYSYEDLKEVLPYYMFVGLRAEEGKHLNNYGLDLNTFKYYLSKNQSNEEMLLPVDTNSSGKRVWMVTTSKDNLMFNNKYLYVEGSYYVLPITSSRWFNTSNGKYYNSGDKVLVNHGMHFIEVK